MMIFDSSITYMKCDKTVQERNMSLANGVLTQFYKVWKLVSKQLINACWTLTVCQETKQQTILYYTKTNCWQKSTVCQDILQ